MSIYELLMPVAILGTLSAGTVLFTKTLTDYFLRKRMVEKGYVTQENKHLLEKASAENKYSNLKWGLIIFFAGIGLVLVNIFPHGHDSTLPFGIFAISVSLGFLIYFLIVKNLTDKN